MSPIQRTGLPSPDFIRPEHIICSPARNRRPLPASVRLAGDKAKSFAANGTEGMEIHWGRTLATCVPQGHTAGHQQQKKRAGQQPTCALSRILLRAARTRRKHT